MYRCDDRVLKIVISRQTEIKPMEMFPLVERMCAINTIFTHDSDDILCYAEWIQRL